MPKKLLQEFVEQIIKEKCKEKNYIFLNKDFIYKNNYIKNLKFKCNICNYEWNCSYYCFINKNSGCPKCGNVLKLAQQKVKERILKKCEEKNYELIEPFVYKNNKEKNIHLRCLNDGYEWYVCYSTFISNNHGCAKCSKTAKLSQQEALNNVLQKCNEKKYILLESFIRKNSHEKNIHLKCLNDGYEWYTTYNKFINSNRGCPKCSGKLKLTQEFVKQKILQKCKEKNYTLIEPFIYKNFDEKNIYLICNNDNYEWCVSYDTFINDNQGCPKCAGNLKKSQNDVNFNILQRCKVLNYELIEPFIYMNIKEKNIHLKCNICNKEWYVNYECFINNEHGCPKCRDKKIEKTTIERYGEIWLKHIPRYNPNSIIYLDLISEKLKLPIQHALNGKERKFQRYYIDGYISDYNICLEWNEQYHNSKKQKEKDLKKKQFLEENFKCHIIYIWEKEFLNDIDNQINLICNKINEIINKI